jgi:PRTRC genetic system protein C
MALSIITMERVFSFTRGTVETSLADPNPVWSPDEVMNFYANTYPELTTSTVHGPEIARDKAVYRFKTVIGTKG